MMGTKSGVDYFNSVATIFLIIFVIFAQVFLYTNSGCI